MRPASGFTASGYHPGGVAVDRQARDIDTRRVLGGLRQTSGHAWPGRCRILAGNGLNWDTVARWPVAFGRHFSRNSPDAMAVEARSRAGECQGCHKADAVLSATVAQNALRREPVARVKLPMRRPLTRSRHA